MLTRDVVVAYRNDPKGLAELFLNEYFGERQQTFPVNPFQMLTDFGVHFVFRSFDGLEGLFLPANDAGEINLVAINANRPITRQRYSAAHELCHFLKDRESQSGFINCVSGSRDPIERYAEEFACALLMPRNEVLRVVGETVARDGALSLDDVLRIAHHFGTSFEACYYRVRELAGEFAPRWDKSCLTCVEGLVLHAEEPVALRA